MQRNKIKNRKNKKTTKTRKVVILDTFLESHAYSVYNIRLKAKKKKYDSLTEVYFEIDEWFKSPLNRYFKYNYYNLIAKIKDFKYKLKNSFNKLIHGFSDDEIMDLDTELMKWLNPRLKRFIELRKEKKEYRGSLGNLTPVKGDNVLKKILWLTEKYKDGYYNIPFCPKENKKVQGATELLGKHIFDLWI